MEEKKAANSQMKLTVIQKENNSRRQYKPPQLINLGDLRSLTLGTSLGVGESTGAGIFRAF